VAPVSQPSEKRIKILHKIYRFNILFCHTFYARCIEFITVGVPPLMLVEGLIYVLELSPLGILIV